MAALPDLEKPEDQARIGGLTAPAVFSGNQGNAGRQILIGAGPGIGTQAVCPVSNPSKDELNGVFSRAEV
jgi:hypothetical protein